MQFCRELGKIVAKKTLHVRNVLINPKGTNTMLYLVQGCRGQYITQGFKEQRDCVMLRPLSFYHVSVLFGASLLSIGAPFFLGKFCNNNKQVQQVL